MIKYCLKCKNCSAEFESWFSSSKEFDRLNRLKHLNCHSCSSTKIEKSLMSPNLNGTKNKNFHQNDQKFKEVKNKLKKYQKFVKDNFEFVGEIPELGPEGKNVATRELSIRLAWDLREYDKPATRLSLLSCINTSDDIYFGSRKC